MRIFYELDAFCENIRWCIADWSFNSTNCSPCIDVNRYCVRRVLYCTYSAYTFYSAHTLSCIFVDFLNASIYLYEWKIFFSNWTLKKNSIPALIFLDFNWPQITLWYRIKMVSVFCIMFLLLQVETVIVGYKIRDPSRRVRIYGRTAGDSKIFSHFLYFPLFNRCFYPQNCKRIIKLK